MARAEKPACRQYQPWLIANYGKGVCAPLTGQDARALRAFVHVLELWACSDRAGQECAAVALGACVAAMQPKVRHLAKQVIPMVLDWGDEPRLWPMIEAAANMTPAVLDAPADVDELRAELAAAATDYIACCAKCWNDWEGDKPPPRRKVDKPDVCRFCGAETTAGIYVSAARAEHVAT